MNYNYIRMITGFFLAYNTFWFWLTGFMVENETEFLLRIAMAILSAGFLFIGTRKND